MPGVYTNTNDLINRWSFFIDNNEFDSTLRNNSSSMSYTDWRSLGELNSDYESPEVIFPIIRRAMPELISNRLFSVTPMEPPRDIDWLKDFEITFKIPKKKKQMEIE